MANTQNLEPYKKGFLEVGDGWFYFIGTPIQDFQLLDTLNNSKLNIMNAGHSGYDPEIFKILKKEMRRITS